MDDPFPPSLPGYQSPQIYSSNETQTMEDITEDLYETPGHMFGDSALSDHAFSPTALKTTENPPANSSQLAGHIWSNSPESSTSSDSSNQHKRTNSSESSATGDVNMTDMPVANGIFIGADPVEAGTIEDEATNKFMESHFDFVSAASSPTPLSSGSRAGFGGPQSSSIRMPLRSFPMVAPSTSYHSVSSGSSGSPEAIPLSMMTKSDPKGWPGAHDNSKPRDQAQSCSPSDLMVPDTSAFHGNFQTGRWGGPHAATGVPIQNFQQQPMAMPYASPAPFMTSNLPRRSKLWISSFPAKTRVESQHVLKYTLDPLPPGINKLHLQPYTMSKPKLMAKPTPERSPDMLEMYATVVCSSAMEDDVKRERALIRAAGSLGDESPGKARKSSIDEVDSTDEARKTPAEDDENKPLNGGPVHICTGCIERERKRANRKKTINPEEQGLWEQEEAKRTVVFNIQEVREWQQPSPPKVTAGKEQSMPSPAYDVEPFFSSNAKQVDIPTRISCYCRHQEEKVGFRIIFTIRDYQDKVVAQEMSSSIMITDDHKTHPTTNAVQHPQMAYPDPHMPGTNIFPQTPSGQYTGFIRNAFSATDLPRLNPNFDPRSMPNQARPFTMPHDFSEATSATLTPRNLSRPASPTSLLPQQNKRRKASGSNRIRSDLMMTKFSDTPATSPIASTSTAPLSGPAFAANTSAVAFSPNYAGPLGSRQYSSNTTPPTPTIVDSSIPSSLSWAPRSQSSDNLAQNIMSTASSTQPSQQASRVPSPRLESRAGGVPHAYGVNGGPHMTGMHPTNGAPQFHGLPHLNGYPETDGMEQHAQMLTHSLQSVNTAPNSHSIPVILDLTPAQGPKSGGIQVTCLGTGFTQGLEVMFGDARATTTTYWGESALLCLVPPAVQAGTVPVTFKHQYDQHITLPFERQKHFRYVDDDQSEVMSLMISIMGRQFDKHNSGQPGNFVEEVREMAQRALADGTASELIKRASKQGTDHQRQASASTATTSDLSQSDTEEDLLRCLEQLDLDDSPGQPNFNLRGSNGQGILHLAVSLGYYRVVSGLLARGAHPDLRDNNGMSPLHMAALHSNVRIIRKLRSAGSDPTLRSLNAFTPADMATSREAQDAINALDHHTRSRSAVATPIVGMSRPASIRSRTSSMGDGPPLSQTRGKNVESQVVYSSQPVTPAHVRARSRRNSYIADMHDPSDGTVEELDPNVSRLATQSLTAWRDQLSLQIHQFQQTVHRALPPLPNLPDYQDYPVVRRISSLVPQRSPQLAPGANGPTHTKETDGHWWELLPWTASAPPAYEDIYPDQSQQSLIDKKASVLCAASEALMDQTCTTMFDHAESSTLMETVRIGRKGLTQQQQDRLRSAHAQENKGLRSDRKLFFVWIPILILVVVATLLYPAPQMFDAARHTYSWVQGRFDGRIEEVV